MEGEEGTQHLNLSEETLVSQCEIVVGLSFKQRTFQEIIAEYDEFNSVFKFCLS